MTKDIATTQISSGSVIGGCKVIRLIGQGGMGEVYLAEHLNLQRQVALKVLPQFRIDAEHVARFLREARASSKIEHVNVVTIHDVGEEDGNHFIVMQYVNGKNLAEIIRAQGGPLPWRSALKIMRHVANGVEAVHKAGLVHRDIKPSNIMVGEGSKVILMDFGLVR
ncbi:MAG: serine/threonine protein kinase, partial [Planctomycetes bacterium]|nr:serine/threonine protein kinase [Planctomycetota bacterium]